MVGLLVLWSAFAGAILSNSAKDAAANDSKTVVVLGDSLAAGYGLDPNEAYPALLQKKIKEAGWNFIVVNAGVSGDTTAGGLRRVEWLLKRRLDVLLLELGGNDGLRGITVESMKANLQAIIDRVKQKYPQAQIVLAGMKMPPNMGAYAEQFNKVFPQLAKENHTALVPFLLEGVGGKPDLNLPDMIHPTAEGHKVVADNVWKTLRPILAKTVASNSTER
jgi:acyl-CoA thioesterase-1